MRGAFSPASPGEHPMVLGFMYEPSDEIDRGALIALLQKSVMTCINQPGNYVIHCLAQQSTARGGPPPPDSCEGRLP